MSACIKSSNTQAAVEIVGRGILDAPYGRAHRLSVREIHRSSGASEATPPAGSVQSATERSKALSAEKYSRKETLVNTGIGGQLFSGVGSSTFDTDIAALRFRLLIFCHADANTTPAYKD